MKKIILALITITLLIGCKKKDNKIITQTQSNLVIKYDSLNVDSIENISTLTGYSPRIDVKPGDKLEFYITKYWPNDIIPANIPANELALIIRLDCVCVIIILCLSWTQNNYNKDKKYFK